MKTLLLITFDFIRYDEPPTSLAVGSLMSRLKSDVRYGDVFNADHLSFNLYQRQSLTLDDILATIADRHELTHLHAIAIGCYIWSDYIVTPLISALRAHGFSGRIILGGYQIAYSHGIQDDYLGADVFILGSAEDSLLRSLELDAQLDSVVLNHDPDFRRLPSPYLTGEIHVVPRQGRVRLETKRGCIRNCTFCADKNLQTHRVYSHELTRVYAELSYLRDMRVKKINVVDPLFNHGTTYLKVMNQCAELGIDARIALQVCFECITDTEGDEFLNICSSLDVVLEFGIQTVIDTEMRNIRRMNDISHAQEVMKTLGRRAIPYEVSLIYGLPGQTFDSFRDSVHFLLDSGCAVIKSYPLKVFKGTELWRTKERWGLIESPEGQFHIPSVVCSASFGRDEWDRMTSLAKAVRRRTQRAIRVCSTVKTDRPRMTR